MKTYNRDDFDKKALGRLLNEKQLSVLFELAHEACRLLFDSVAGDGCWQSEFTADQRKIICQRVIVRMVGELFGPEQSPTERPSRVH